MPNIVLTIHEPTVEEAVDSIRSYEDRVDAIEIRVDRLDPRAERGFDASMIRRVSSKPMIYTRRSAESSSFLSPAEVREAVDAGFDLVDVELRPGCEKLVDAAGAERVILSHHDFDGMPDVGAVVSSMRGLGPAHRKIAVTPRTFAENVALLERLGSGEAGLTIFGMGDRGLYSRILAPFFGSELVFVARDTGSIAAPGQITVDRAREIYGASPLSLARPASIYAVVGKPAGHSRSPAIHNAVFRERNVPAAYSIIESERLAPVIDAMSKEGACVPRGISITAPFKREAYEIARERGWPVDSRASACGSVNTVVRFDGDDPGVLRAYNTDVDGFSAALDLAPRRGRRLAIVGAGGTARAAAVAAKARGLDVSVFNRTRQTADALAFELGLRSFELDALGSFDGDVIVNTLTAGADVRFPDSVFRRGRLFVDVGYAEGATAFADRARSAGMVVFDGMSLLEAQAADQSRLFLRAMEGLDDGCDG